MYYDGIHYNVVLLDDAGGVPGSVWYNPDDSYTIFIDAHLSDAQQKKVFRHEMWHIRQRDFEKYDVQGIESCAHTENGV